MLPSYEMVLISALIVALIVDLHSQKIPNYLTGSAILLSISCHIFADGISGLTFSLKGLGLGLTMLLPFYLFCMIGAGDVKLMGVVGAALGAAKTLNAFFYIAIAGGIYSLFILASNHILLQSVLKRSILSVKTFIFTGKVSYVSPTEDEKKFKLCYGVAISLGTMSYMLWEHMGYSSYSEFFSKFLSKVI